MQRAQSPREKNGREKDDRGQRWLPVIACAAALLVLAGAAWPPLGALALVLAASGACALALARRPSRGLRAVVIGIALWLLLALAGAWRLAGTHERGLVFVLLALFAAPAPVLPWLYARTFTTPER